MGLEQIVERLAKEWAVISEAPISVAIIVAVCITAAWAAVKWQYGALLGHKDSALKLKDAEIADYKRKAGPTPDAAAEKIAALEKRLDALTPVPIEELQEGLKSAEAVARQNQIREIVDRYLETHTEPPPDKWINGELKKLGISWRVVNKQTHYETFEPARWG